MDGEYILVASDDCEDIEVYHKDEVKVYWEKWRAGQEIPETLRTMFEKLEGP